MDPRSAIPIFPQSRALRVGDPRSLQSCEWAEDGLDSVLADFVTKRGGALISLSLPVLLALLVLSDSFPPPMMLSAAAAPVVVTAPPTIRARPTSMPSRLQGSLPLILLVLTPATFISVVIASFLPLPSLMPCSVPYFATLVL
jgi:hypothetical protein